MIDGEQFLDLREIAQSLNTYHATVYKWCSGGELPFTDRDGKRVVRRRDLDLFVKRRVEKALAAIPWNIGIALRAVAKQSGVPLERLLVQAPQGDVLAFVEKALKVRR